MRARFGAAMTAGLLLATWAQTRFGARRTVQLGLTLFILGSLLALIPSWGVRSTKG